MVPVSPMDWPGHYWASVRRVRSPERPELLLPRRWLCQSPKSSFPSPPPVVMYQGIPCYYISGNFYPVAAIR